MNVSKYENLFFMLSSAEISTKSTWYLSCSLLVLIYLATLFLLMSFVYPTVYVFINSSQSK